jgi:hypothetical protein
MAATGTVGYESESPVEEGEGITWVGGRRSITPKCSKET